MLKRTFEVIALVAILNPVILPILTGDLSPLRNRFFLKYAEDQGSDNETLTLVVFAAIFFLSGLLLLTAILQHRIKLKVVLTNFALPSLVVTLAILSVLWASDKYQALQDSIFLLGVLIFFVYLASSQSRQSSARSLIVAMRILAYGSVLFLLLFPDLAMPEYQDGAALRGVFEHKSQLGLMLAALIMLIVRDAQLRPSKVNLIEIAVLAVLVLISRSMTAVAMLMLFGALVMVLSTFVRVQGGTSRLVLLIGTAVVAVAIVTGLFSVALEAMGRDATLTGRVPIWTVSIELGSDRFLTGHGYKAFFKDEGLGYGVEIRRAIGEHVPHPHNSYVAAFLDFGIFGALFFSYFIVSRVMAATHPVIRQGSRDDISRLALLITLAILGIVESELLHHSGFYFGLFAMFAYPESAKRAARRLNRSAHRHSAN